MFNKIRSIVATAYNYTHIFVGAGAVVTSFLDTQQLPPSAAAGVVIASQALRVFSDWITAAHAIAPTAEKVVEGLVDQAKAVTVLPAEPALNPVVPVTPAPAAASTPPAVS